MCAHSTVPTLIQSVNTTFPPEKLWCYSRLLKTLTLFFKGPDFYIWHINFRFMIIPTRQLSDGYLPTHISVFLCLWSGLLEEQQRAITTKLCVWFNHMNIIWFKMFSRTQQYTTPFASRTAIAQKGLLCQLEMVSRPNWLSIQIVTRLLLFNVGKG